MQTLERTLREYDMPLLAVIAARWDVDLESYSVTDVADLLLAAMLNAEAAAETWDRLDDTERQAMQTLLGASGVMPVKMFARLFGEIREMGPGKMEREKPYLNPASVAESLFYRGLIARGFDEGAAGTRAVIFVPTDLAAALPTHHTGFDLSVEEDDDFPDEDEDDEAWQLPAEQPDEIIQADTTIVDDMTTLLAYMQVAAVTPTTSGALPQVHTDVLNKYLLKPDPERLDFLLGLARSLNLLAPREELLKPVSQSARNWMDAPRSEQVRLLAAGWRESIAYSELRHLPDLVVENADADPRLARQTIIDQLAAMPHDSWWSPDNLIAEVKETQPDFQRPGSDYDGWYLRDGPDGDYLRGFESWDLVDGAVLRFIMTGPLHWLGLADLGLYAGQTIGHLNAYGRAFLTDSEWPTPPEATESLVLHEDGGADASRKMNRYDRFQLARFTEWQAAGEPYRYRFSLRGLNRAFIQGIQADHIRAYLARVASTDMPDKIETLLARWEQTADADATIERLMVLRMASSQALDSALEEPTVRRYLGARLGPEAVIIRSSQAAALQDALADHGILAEILGSTEEDRPA